MEVKQLKELLNLQRHYTGKLESVIKNLETEDIQKENSRLIGEAVSLKNEIEELKLKNIELSIKKDQLKKEYNSLKSITLDKYEEKKQFILKECMKKSSLYFEREKEGGVNRLEKIRKLEKNKLEQLRKYMEKEELEVIEETEDLLKNTEKFIEKKIEEAKNKVSEESDSMKSKHAGEYKPLFEEKVSEEAIKEDLKNNNLELKFGTKWVNLIGIAFIVIAIVLTAKYSYLNLFKSNEMKAVLFYLIGTTLLIGGEYLNKKGKNYFSLSTTGGGIGILYISTGVSYFYFGIINIPTALLMCILTTIVALTLSIKYDAEIISILAVIGGYLPVIAMERVDTGYIYGLLAYLMIFNIFSYVISYKKMWIKPKFTNIALNFISLFYITEGLGLVEVIPFYVLILYILVSVTFYLAMTLLKESDQSNGGLSRQLLLLISLLSSILIFNIIGNYNYTHLNGVFAIALFIYYFIFGKVLQSRGGKHETMILLYFISIIFGILIIPLQFGVEYASLAWLLEGTVICGYGISQKEKKFSTIGALLIMIATILVIFKDRVEFFKYTLLTLSYLSILVVTIKSRDEKLEEMLGDYNRFIEVIRNVNIVNICFYFFVLGNHLSQKLEAVTRLDGMNIGVLLLILFNILLPQIKLFDVREGENENKIITLISYMVLMHLGRFVDLSIKNINLSGVLYSISILALFHIFFKLVKNPKIKYEHKDLLFNGLGAILILNILNANKVSSMLFTCIIGVSGLVYLFYGFLKYNPKLRRCGLALTIVSTMKLFIYDLFYLSVFGKIVSYFTFGIILMGTSYFYQYYVKKVELKLREVDGEDEQNNQSM